MINDVIDIALEAGEAILEIYHHDFDVDQKSDNTPVTAADLAANHHIIARLTALTPGMPILTEESALAPWSERQHWSRYWLVDPLDGTKEFVKRNGDFTVNIALVDAHEAVLGVVYAPARQELWYAVAGQGAFYRHTHDVVNPVKLKTCSVPDQDQPWLALGSRSFHEDIVQAFLNDLGPHSLAPVGSAIKTCMIAAGQAHIYPRLGLTSEWDTAASQVIIEQAGGLLINAKTGLRLQYNTKESLLNPWFVAACADDPRWRHSLNRITM